MLYQVIVSSRKLCVILRGNKSEGKCKGCVAPADAGILIWESTSRRTCVVLAYFKMLLLLRHTASCSSFVVLPTYILFEFCFMMVTFWFGLREQYPYKLCYEYFQSAGKSTDMFVLFNPC